jgi:hypothetical protein
MDVGFNLERVSNEVIAYLISMFSGYTAEISFKNSKKCELKDRNTVDLSAITI